MRFQLWINMDNDAFALDPYEELQKGLLNALRGLAYRQQECQIMDVNGNIVGMYVVDGDPR